MSCNYEEQHLHVLCRLRITTNTDYLNDQKMSVTSSQVMCKENIRKIVENNENLE